MSRLYDRPYDTVVSHIVFSWKHPETLGYLCIICIATIIVIGRETSWV
jgi:hypothetical protein